MGLIIIGLVCGAVAALFADRRRVALLKAQLASSKDGLARTKAELEERISELEYHYEDMKSFAVFCSICEAYVLPGTSFTTENVRDSHGILTGEKRFKCEQCHRTADHEDMVVR
jgi:hypothetical protein